MTNNHDTRYMNAFQIIDCNFQVYKNQRAGTGNDKYRACIELYKAFKVTIEGCNFESLENEITNSRKRTGIIAYQSSFFMHKSGNFRRNQDIITTGEIRKNCLKYGREQDLSNYPSDHPWDTINPNKNIFTNFYRAIDYVGEVSLTGHYTFVLDDCIFQECFYPVKVERGVNTTITNSTFSYTESKQGFSDITNGAETHFRDSHFSSWIELNDHDRFDIVIFESKNALISNNTFTSDYNGPTTTKVGKNISIGIISQLAGAYNDNKKKYIYDLIYANVFSPLNHSEDIGCYIGVQQAPSFTLLNCNQFNNLKYACLVGRHNTELKDQFHYLDMDSGRNAPALNTFNNCTCEFGFPDAFNQSNVKYYYKIGGNPPTSCKISGGNGFLNNIQASSTEIEECSAFNCIKFPMTTDVKNNEFNILEISLYPNPNRGDFIIELSIPLEDGIINLFDVKGRLIKSYNTSKSSRFNKIDEPLVKGVYIVRIHSNRFNQHKYFLVE